MGDIRLGIVEKKFADIIWENEPLRSGELVKICEKELNWKKSTTYTVLHKLCERGFFKNENGQITSLLSEAEYFSRQSEQFIEDNFQGSLPAFIAAFTKRRKLSEKEIMELRKIIDSH